MKDLFVKKKQEVEATKAYRGNFRQDKLRHLITARELNIFCFLIIDLISIKDSIVL